MQQRKHFSLEEKRQHVANWQAPAVLPANSTASFTTLSFPHSGSGLRTPNPLSVKMTPG